ncbi:predicted protein [Scheffersomyces stipitis CBS 6054]|uniref:Uncharacterized protein n=1 Tax=Scheffersomyces stipitis (strain ATCC 58785 / CBS 6054 / NBRC 10063 / NRRL Y-11545) TaxID=322104 RepID=A3LW34_PICST|nr:predicted protein [Scheffersomyces stipitis CBS 6054]ABN66894.2 predicted protein [Scheffersomyces stipitis CBS 6054]
MDFSQSYYYFGNLEKRATSWRSMSSSITHVTSDLKAGDSSDILIEAIHRFHLQIQPSIALDPKDISKPGELIAKLDILHEYYSEIKSSLQVFSSREHSHLWLSFMCGMVAALRRFNQYYCVKYLNATYFEAESYLTLAPQISTRVTQYTFEYAAYLKTMLADDGVSIATIINCASSRSIRHFFDILIDSLDFISMDKVEDDEDLQSAEVILEAVQHGLLRYYETIDTCSSQIRDNLYNRAFSTLTNFLQVAYTIGKSELVIPFFSSTRNGSVPIINPESAINIVRTDTVSLVDLINYYKFTAFNLTTLSISEESCATKYNEQADLYFRILLSFPNLSRSIFMKLQFGVEDDHIKDPFGPSQQLMHLEFTPGSKQQESLVSLVDRQEISFIYIINFLLKSKSLRSVLDATSHYKSEMIFFVRSLSCSNAKELDKSASRPGSAHSSVVSFPKLNQLEQERNDEFRMQKVLNKLKLRSLSAVIVHGSYKEKLTLIVKFCKLLETGSFNLSVLSAHYGGNINDPNHFLNTIGTPSPGKRLHIIAIDRIVKLLIVLGLFHLMDTMGINEVRESYVVELFSLRVPIEDCLQIWPKHNFKIATLPSGDRLVSYAAQVTSTEERSLSARFAKMQEISDTTKELQKTAKVLN